MSSGYYYYYYYYIIIIIKVHRMQNTLGPNCTMQHC